MGRRSKVVSGRWKCGCEFFNISMRDLPKRCKTHPTKAIDKKSIVEGAVDQIKAAAMPKPLEGYKQMVMEAAVEASQSGEPVVVIEQHSMGNGWYKGWHVGDDRDDGDLAAKLAIAIAYFAKKNLHFNVARVNLKENVKDGDIVNGLTIRKDKSVLPNQVLLGVEE